mmetsp:Transcript_97224/g.280567  ORF Transcript_97224/g.280567 Transcript_97224/m.280567 type:complete len:212 (+) Transcript_97224:300-935(+)
MRLGLALPQPAGSAGSQPSAGRRSLGEGGVGEQPLERQRGQRLYPRAHPHGSGRSLDRRQPSSHRDVGGCCHALGRQEHRSHPAVHLWHFGHQRSADLEQPRAVEALPLEDQIQHSRRGCPFALGGEPCVGQVLCPVYINGFWRRPRRYPEAHDRCSRCFVEGRQAPQVTLAPCKLEGPLGQRACGPHHRGAEGGVGGSGTAAALRLAVAH